MHESQFEVRGSGYTFICRFFFLFDPLSVSNVVKVKNGH